jgi:hypothetical protein
VAVEFGQGGTTLELLQIVEDRLLDQPVRRAVNGLRSCFEALAGRVVEFDPKGGRRHFLSSLLPRVWHQLAARLAVDNSGATGCNPKFSGQRCNSSEGRFRTAEKVFLGILLWKRAFCSEMEQQKMRIDFSAREMVAPGSRCCIGCAAWVQPSSCTAVAGDKNKARAQLMGNPLTITFVIYIAAMVLIGFMAYRSTNNLSDYILGGRSLGSVVTALSAGASDMSGWLLMGLPGAIYMSGLSEAGSPSA